MLSPALLSCKTGCSKKPNLLDQNLNKHKENKDEILVQHLVDQMQIIAIVQIYYI